MRELELDKPQDLLLDYQPSSLRFRLSMAFSLGSLSSLLGRTGPGGSITGVGSSFILLPRFLKASPVFQEVGCDVIAVRSLLPTPSTILLIADNDVAKVPTLVFDLAYCLHERRK